MNLYNLVLGAPVFPDKGMVMAGKINLKKMMKDVENSFSFADFHQMVVYFHTQMRRGLNGEASSLKMLPAFIDCPAGKEKGLFMALDLGGTNFRVLLVRLMGKKGIAVEQVGKYVIPRNVTSGTGVELFDFLARSIQQFLADHEIGQQKTISLGFTFSFPINQTAINRGILINWTKGFSATGVAGQDVAGMLADALHRHKIHNVEVTALVNDTVGTLIAKAYDIQDCDVGVIFGTGTNACYRESAAAHLKLVTAEKMIERMIVNIEWGNFNCLPVNHYDHALDKSSSNPGKQQMEKMISGMYLGELARLVIADLMQSKVIFQKYSLGFLQGDMTTQDISAIESDRTPEFVKVAAYLKEAGIAETSLEERRCVRQICCYVSRRAARISAAAISAVVTWMDPGLDQSHTIAIDGTLYAKYPGFKRTLMKTLDKLHGDKSKMIQLVLASDGSGIGGAIAAAVAAETHK